MRHNTPGGSILIVDDTLDNLRLLSHMLTERGYSVRAAKSGLEALASIQAAKPDLLLLDIKLPDLSGYEVCARLKADSATSDLPIVFLSVMDETKDKLQGFKAGGVDYITKPFHAEEVLARVHTHIEIGRLREELERQAVDLRDSQHLLMESQVIAGLGTYVLEIPKGTWTSSVVLDGIFGIDENYVRSVEGWGSLIHPDCRDMMLEYFAREVIAKCSLFDKEYKIVRHDNGEERWVHGLGELEKNENGKPVRMIGTIMDITDRKRLDTALQKSQSLLAKAELMGNVGGWEFDIDTLQQTWTEGVYRIHELDLSYLPTVDKGINFYTQASRPIIEQAVQRAIEHEKPFDLELEIITAKGNLRQVHAMGSAELARRKVFGFFQDITDRKQAESSLRTLSLRQEAILAAVPDIIMEVNKNKEYIWANRPGIEFFGDDVIGKEAAFYFEGEQDTYNNVQPLFEGVDNTIYLESWQRRKDGQKRFLGWWCRVLKDENGNVTGALSTARDLTERKQAETALSESEERFRNVFENASVGKSMTSLDGRIKVNRAFCEMVGYSPEELSKLKWQQLTHRDDIDRDQQIINSLIARERDSARWEKRYIHKEGNIVWADVATVLQRDRAGKPLYFITTVVDITERRSAEATLQKSEKRLREAQEMAHLGFWTWNVKTGEVEWSEEVFKIFCLDPKEFTPQIDSILALSPWPEDRHRDQELIKKAIETHSPGAYEQRFLRPDQSIGHYYSTFQGVYDEKGDLISIVGTVLDITERKCAEDALRASKDELHRLLKSMTAAFVLFESVFADDGHFISYRFVYINEAYERLTGVKNDEVKGKTIHEVWPNTEPEWIKRYGEVAVTGVSQTFDMYHGPTAHHYHCNVYRPGDTQDRFCVVFEDITERKRLEKEQFRLLDILENSLNEIYVFDSSTLRFEYVNQGALRNIGYSLSEMQSLTPIDIKPQYTEGAFRDFIRPLIQEEQKKLVFETMHRRKNGTTYSIEAHLQLHKQEGKSLFFAVINDITVRKMAKEALLESEKKYHAVVDKANDGIMIGQDGVMKLSNASFAAMLGYEVLEVEGVEFSKMIPPENMGFLLERYQKRLAGEIVPAKYETALLHKNGERIPVEVNASIVQYEGKSADLVVMRDITERKHSEEKILSQLKELRRWQEVTLGREDRNRELKREVNELLLRLGETVRYPSQEDDRKQNEE